MRLDMQRVRKNVQQADTEDLLNRVTVYREGMEPEALVIIEQELRQRGISAAAVRDHAENVQRGVLRLADGCAARCSFCQQPAVSAGWGWHSLWGRLPLFPRYFYYCKGHAPAQAKN